MKLGHTVLKILIEMGHIYRSDTSRIVHQPWFLINFLDFWAFKFVCYSHKLVTYFCQSDISLSTYEYLKRCLIYIESRMVPVHHHYFFRYKTPNKSQICWHIAIAGAFFKAYLASTKDFCQMNTASDLFFQIQS